MTPSDDHRLDGRGLPALEARLREDLIFLCHPGKDWVPPREGVSDVVIIGGGMCGMVAWLGLRTGGLRLVQATALGLAATPVGGFDPDTVARLLALPPGHEVLYLVPVGA